MPRIFDMRMNDGSRHFADLPETYDTAQPQWYALRDHIAALNGARPTGFVTDDVTEAWIDFEYREQRFSINNQRARWWFFVADPNCSDEVLETVLAHFEALLGPA